MDAKGEPSGILVLGEVKDGASFRTYLDGQLSRFAKELGDAPNVRIIDDPMSVTIASQATLTAVNDSVKMKDAPAKNVSIKSEVFVWIHDDIFAASPQIERLRGLATVLNAPDTNRFKGSAFNQRINDIYRDGAGLVVAADLEKIIAQAVSKDDKPGAERRQKASNSLE
jgi:hypothetical protein